MCGVIAELKSLMLIVYGRTYGQTDSNDDSYKKLRL